MSPDGWLMVSISSSLGLMILLIIRASSRDRLEARAEIEPGEVYEYRFALQPTSNLFRQGHQIRLEVSSSNFPHYDRNLNTGEEPGMGTKMRTARQTILHDAEHPSRLILPVVSAPLIQADTGAAQPEGSAAFE